MQVSHKFERYHESFSLNIIAPRELRRAKKQPTLKVHLEDAGPVSLTHDIKYAHAIHMYIYIYNIYIYILYIYTQQAATYPEKGFCDGCMFTRLSLSNL